MSKATKLLKALGYSYFVTIVLILIYNLFLTYTPLKSSTIPIVTSLIITLGAACAGFYMAYKNSSKGFLYGILSGALYIFFIIIIYFLAQDNFKFEGNIIYKILLDIIAGGIGGIIGVNMKKD
ncbi:TIGR04086 family membrane protein [Tepidibacter formicigenes]|jgi:putative membrane protein (TIGR04086 family)|uniref:Putative membrane protein, TIGR04086 family n=1 Tax=Tepidibacter formicigenes DSM 15518 TaxID=1123349 RepID=A0A1M6MWP4_9FIRM|nr:TIGR04086 family membrane protein [Tepidibacter formicigenes]SHJ87703.1 putative membrane protein, TIGR04086 family [Tepidibacter formicigenes DSM 15518]